MSQPHNQSLLTSPLSNEPPPRDLALEILWQHHQLILDAIGEGVYGLDIEGNVTFVNPAAAKMIGWSTAELIGQPMHAVLHHSHPNGSHYPKENCPIYAAFRDGKVYRVTDEVFWRRDGTCFPVEYISTPIHDEQGQIVGAVVTFCDITQRQWAESVLKQTNEVLESKVRERTAELEQVNQQLQELSALKSRFVAMVCHEFRNPLNNIALSISSLNRYHSRLTVRQQSEYLAGIAENVERMTEMIDDILVIGKLDAKRMELKSAEVDLVAFCQDLVAEVQSMAPHHVVLLICRHRQLITPIDVQLLRSILTNILHNAIRYSPEDGEIQFKVSRRKHIITFQISDQGMGVSPEEQSLIFDPFYRGKNVSNVPGTGLGLSIVKQFVELLQGTITLDSRIGVGTTFTVRLPCSR
ncbi:PAS domain-containing sensor histidine kinase [Acaryochloris marina]|uniref:histidine kinase n=1 Tax=Acaryochloris marina (strain MBIC 11017) TaxID=329726 RepID=B0C8H7_ACAM1|nr:ATP-binding protein [Acaryochloris marina]ABW30132.1 two-component sensor histidine kinase, putative [Acaryochloris marina MBIC11017]